MRLSTKTTERFAPDWNDNLELPDADRVYVTVEYPDCETRDDLRTTETRARFRKDRKEEEEREDQDLIIETRFDTKRILANHVPKIEGFDQKVDGKPQEVTTGAMLLKCKHPKAPDLRDKIVAKVMGEEISEDQEKNSEQPSTS